MSALLLQCCFVLHGGLMSRKFFADLGANCNSDDFRITRLWGEQASEIKIEGLNYYTNLNKVQYMDYHPIYIVHEGAKRCIAKFHDISDSILFTDLVMSIIFPDMEGISGEPYFEEDFLDCSTIYKHHKSPISIHCMY